MDAERASDVMTCRGGAAKRSKMVADSLDVMICRRCRGREGRREKREIVAS